jgi:hypothetical protein
MASSRVLIASCTLFLVTLVMVPGCGGPTKGSLSGSITYADKPVKIGKILAWGGDGSVREGDINPDGTYQVNDVVAGAITLCILSANPAETPERKEPGAPKSDAPKVNPKDWFPIPVEYTDVKASPLKTTITSGANKYDIKMTKK